MSVGTSDGGTRKRNHPQRQSVVRGECDEDNDMRVHFQDRIEPLIIEPIVGAPGVCVSLTMRSETDAISMVVDRLMSLIRLPHCLPADERDVEIALREALANAVIHGNKEDLRKKVHIDCHVHPGRELAFVIRDEGAGFDPAMVPDPTKAENVLAEKGRGIHLMKMLMNEVHFDDAGREVRLQKFLRRY
jgi:serine/threonine-protein kinase RsbW